MATKPLPKLIQEAIHAYVESEAIGEGVRKEKLPTVTEALEKGEIQLLELVLAMDPFLNDTMNPQGRRWAIMLLAECLREVQSLKLNAKHIETLVGFFCSRVSDWQGVEGSANGLLAILQQHSVPLRTLKDPDARQPMATYIARTLFSEINMQSHTQQVRKVVLECMTLLMQDWQAEVALLGEDVGDGVNRIIEEERDPRNLLISFKLVARLLESYPEGCVTDGSLSQLFEHLTSYFPITFKPPPGDKVGITGDDLRDGLNSCLGGTVRFAEHLMPFLLDNTKDITVGDNEETISQALDLLSFSFERYGAEIAQKWIERTLDTARDQTCRTETPCPTKFAEMVRRALVVTLSTVPKGLMPNWITKEIIPALKRLAEDAARGEGSLMIEGARRLLLAAAEAHPLLAERIWAMALPQLMEPVKAAEAPAEGEEAPAEPVEDDGPKKINFKAVTFVLALSKLMEADGKSILSWGQLKPTVDAALATLLIVDPNHTFAHEITTIDLKDPQKPSSSKVVEAVPTGPKGIAALVTLVGQLGKLAGEEGSSEAFFFLRALLLRPPSGEGSTEVVNWAAGWRAELHTSDADDSTLPDALLGAVSCIIESQVARAEDFVPTVLALAIQPAFSPPPRTEGGGSSHWLQAALPKLLADTGISLSRLAAAANPTDKERAAKAAKAADDVLQRAAGFTEYKSAFQAPEAVHALECVTASLDEILVDGTQAAWAASRLASALSLPKELAKIGSGPTHAESKMLRALATRDFMRSLIARLPAGEAAEMRRSILKTATDTKIEDRFAAVALIPAALPALAAEDWAVCNAALPTICKEASESAEDHMEEPSVVALEKLVESCPTAEVEKLIASVKSTYKHLLEAPEGESKFSKGASRGAALVWAAVAGGLLRRGGFSPQATAFLEVLRASLKEGGHVTEFVPLAYQVLMPPQFDGDKTHALGHGALGIPTLAVQQLAFTALKATTEFAQEEMAKEFHDHLLVAKVAMRAALQSAVALLCALPVETVIADFNAEFRWCVLTGLRLVGEEAGNPVVKLVRDQSPSRRKFAACHEATFAGQVLQLLVRAAKKGAPWVEDDLQAIIPHITESCLSHRVPLVRLGCMQALSLLIESSYGHLLPYKRRIRAATQKTIEDKRREVRLVAVQSLNLWQCKSTQEH